MNKITIVNDNLEKDYATKNEIPTKVSQLENDSEYANIEFVSQGLNLKQDKGFYSTDGFALLDDSNTDLIDEYGKYVKRTDKSLDIYIFMYKKALKKILQGFFQLLDTDDKVGFCKFFCNLAEGHNYIFLCIHTVYYYSQLFEKVNKNNRKKSTFLRIYQDYFRTSLA